MQLTADKDLKGRGKLVYWQLVNIHILYHFQLWFPQGSFCMCFAPLCTSTSSHSAIFNIFIYCLEHLWITWQVPRCSCELRKSQTLQSRFFIDLSCKAICTFGIPWCPSNNSALAKKIKSKISKMELCQIYEPCVVIFLP